MRARLSVCCSNEGARFRPRRGDVKQKSGVCAILFVGKFYEDDLTPTSSGVFNGERWLRRVYGRHAIAHDVQIFRLVTLTYPRPQHLPKQSCKRPK